MLGRRNASVAYYPGRVHPFSGSLEPQEQDRARSRAAGLDAHLTKPVDLRELQQLLATAADAFSPVGAGRISVVGAHRARIDPLRSGLPGATACRPAT